jgi:hypothetical protein
MKLLSSSALTLLALAGSTSADYFSAGWTPGQNPHAEVPTATFASTAALPTGTAAAAQPRRTSKPFSLSSLFDLNNILTSEPVAALFNTFGVNITERVALQQKIWDDRVQLITDDNFNDLIVNEPMTPEEEKERVWIFVMCVGYLASIEEVKLTSTPSSVTASKQEGVSKYLDNVFDSAFNETHIAGDLPHVRWGRIDYMNVTYVTTKWAVWQYELILTSLRIFVDITPPEPHTLLSQQTAVKAFASTAPTISG